jgi:hypothetical protein
MYQPMLTRLHDTDLGPTHVAVGDRTSSLPGCRHLLCLLKRFTKGSRVERPEGSLPAFAWGEKPPLSTPLQHGLRLLPLPLPAVA